jgi:hypothetical protein
MKDVTLFETVVRWNTIEVDEDFDPSTLDQNLSIMGQMMSNAAHGWDGEDVLETRWESE